LQALLFVSGALPASLTFVGGEQVEFKNNFLNLPLGGRPSTTFQGETIRNGCGVGTIGASPFVYVNANPIVMGWAKTNPTAACVGSTVSLSFAVSGAASATMVYQVEIGEIEYYSQEFVRKQVLATGTGNPLSFTLPANFTPGFYHLRLVAQSPLSVSDVLPFAVQKPVVASFDVYDSRYQHLVQTSDAVTMSNVNYDTPLPLTVTLSDGTRKPVVDFNGRQGYFSFDASKTGSFFVKSVSNTCGTGTLAKTDTVFVVPFRLVNTLAPRTGYCAGSVVRVPFSVEGKLPADTRITVQLAYGLNGAFRPLTVLQQESGVVTVQLPDTLRHTSSSRDNDYYLIRLLAPEKGVSVGIPVVFYGRRLPQFALTGPPGTSGPILYDLTKSAVTLNLNVRGSLPTYGFVDGFVYHTPGSGYESYPNNGEITFNSDPSETVNYLYVSPTKRTTYSAKLAYNMCGYGSVSGQVTVGVLPKITLDDSYTPITVCESGTLSVSGQATGDFDSTNQFRVLLSQGQDQRVLPDDKELIRVASVDKPVAVQIPKGTPAGYYTLKIAATQSDALVSTLRSVQVANVARAELSGNNTINPGDATYLTLKLAGDGPYAYELSDGTTGLANSYSPLWLVSVRPSVTTTYQISRVANGCGAGQVAGQAEVIVNPAPAFAIRLEERTLFSSVCAEAKIPVPFSVSGVTGVTPTYTVQLSDETGRNFASIPTVGTVPSLTATIPATTPAGGGYRLRVVVNGPGVVSSASPVSFSVSTAPDATLLAPALVVPGQPASLTIIAKGDGPFYVQVGDSTQRQTIYTAQPVYVLTVYPVKPTTYQIFYISNSCGATVPAQKGIVMVGLLTALEPPFGPDDWQVMPNPATSVVQVKTPRPVWVKQINVLSMTGQLVQQTTVNQQVKQQIDLDVQRLPAGLYLIQVNTEHGIMNAKLLKQ
jgi:Secretion system C-terminal sorting domain